MEHRYNQPFPLIPSSHLPSHSMFVRLVASAAWFVSPSSGHDFFVLFFVLVLFCHQVALDEEANYNKPLPSLLLGLEFHHTCSMVRLYRSYIYYIHSLIFILPALLAPYSKCIIIQQMYHLNHFYLCLLYHHCQSPSSSYSVLQ